MKWVKGNKTIDISVEELRELAAKYNKIHVDLGTGDGRFVYESALRDQSTLFVGVDPVEKQLREYSVKSVRKKLNNAVFLVSSLENLPITMTEIADKVSIILPWGSLLGQIVNPAKEAMNKITALLKPFGELEIILGYSPDSEPSESDRLELPELSQGYVENVIIKAFEGVSGTIKLDKIELFPKEKLTNIGSNWAKKLAFGKPRQIYRITLLKTR
ncbi:MAG: 16S rRNA (adenine(1408)-N(1))-methyltransferase [candidate division WWE3 bacterium GW2011_GWF2_41_45]|uniref:16S rRNA (Adenine(1408)-N(1))-methyltransferase n=2 Tax=Katanobacteria TaxID=422282 RepID=A0A1F4W3X0_UNCKA|nr:MAG: 16S rRNA (adenine(1408)-N(1))-methyltransferase [candidate division WWE3 bacterium GW2011_GWC2_41_23]KKS10006.1 MAG: 16S rRNA (adenine(1408)-N(1))-methyltransferase [candidate division WWE3 bacterium GW2011_GWF2_41_45]KKS11966.1 MAG: 16S rRNA (adenine(1408)-N(1))-methyltransferase [candidate division WWE3 bacterium GW2011_GWF1_41_53]KKS19856.1 MAG: 16S rRNA (adenine(1408)-N(1))-methyltransferase [candidate division WWE3 bacterium GW2011_GWE1_41_72]KKS50328.1 MAG: 16S rRNA (adenine(1408)